MGHVTVRDRAVDIGLVADRVTECPHGRLAHDRIVAQGSKRRGRVPPAGEHLFDAPT